jgi:hypothetical protein
MARNISCTQSKIFNKWGILANPGKKQQHKRKKMPMSLRIQIWQQYNGNNMVGRCWVCGEELHFKDAVLAHKMALCKGGSNCPANLVPTHSLCNTSMCADSALSFIRKYHPHREQILKKRGWL